MYAMQSKMFFFVLVMCSICLGCSSPTDNKKDETPDQKITPTAQVTIHEPFYGTVAHNGDQSITITYDIMNTGTVDINEYTFALRIIVHSTLYKDEPNITYIEKVHEIQEPYTLFSKPLPPGEIYTANVNSQIHVNYELISITVDNLTLQ